MSGYPKEIKGVKPAKTNRFKVEELLKKKIDFGKVTVNVVTEKVAGRNWKEWHHAYGGAILMLLGFGLGLAFNPRWAYTFCPLGFLIFVDDFAKDIAGVKTTPLRVLNDWLGRHFPIYNKICGVLDWLCGKRR